MALHRRVSQRCHELPCCRSEPERSWSTQAAPSRSLSFQEGRPSCDLGPMPQPEGGIEAA